MSSIPSCCLLPSILVKQMGCPVEVLEETLDPSKCGAIFVRRAVNRATRQHAATSRYAGLSLTRHPLLLDPVVPVGLDSSTAGKTGGGGKVNASRRRWSTYLKGANHKNYKSKLEAWQSLCRGARILQRFDEAGRSHDVERLVIESACPVWERARRFEGSIHPSALSVHVGQPTSASRARMTSVDGLAFF